MPRPASPPISPCEQRQQPHPCGDAVLGGQFGVRRRDQRRAHIRRSTVPRSRRALECRAPHRRDVRLVPSVCDATASADQGHGRRCRRPRPARVPRRQGAAAQLSLPGPRPPSAPASTSASIRSPMSQRGSPFSASGSASETSSRRSRGCVTPSRWRRNARVGSARKSTRSSQGHLVLGERRQRGRQGAAASAAVLGEPLGSRVGLSGRS